MNPLKWSKARWWALVAQVFIWIAVGLVLQPDLLGWVLLGMLGAIANFYGRTAQLDDLDHAVHDELREARERRRRAA